MQYSPKLKKAMSEIDDVLKKYDIAAFVLLQDGKGFAEFRNKVDPSFSALRTVNGGIRVRLKAAEVGGQEKAKQIAEVTYNLVCHFFDMLTMHAKVYQELKTMLKSHWGGEDGEGSVTGHIEQNN